MNGGTLAKVAATALGLIALASVLGAERVPALAQDPGARLASARVPELDFRAAPLADAVEFLRQASVQYDPAPDPAQRTGVNFVVNLQRGVAAGGGLAAVPPITFKARDISLLEALRVMTQVAGLKYRIEGNVVLIVPRDAPDGPIIQRTYSVLPTLVEKARQRQGQSP